MAEDADLTPETVVLLTCGACGAAVSPAIPEDAEVPGLIACDGRPYNPHPMRDMVATTYRREA